MIPGFGDKSAKPGSPPLIDRPLLTGRAQKRSHVRPIVLQPKGDGPCPRITTKDGTEIFYKDWGSGQPIVFSHGWPLSADDWDAQMLFFLARAIA